MEGRLRGASEDSGGEKLNTKEEKKTIYITQLLERKSLVLKVVVVMIVGMNH